jgi:hypothetical protein
MARTFRTWAVMRDGPIRANLKQLSSEDSFWNDQLLLFIWNERMVLRSMDLKMQFQGYSVGLFKTPVQAVGDFLYPIPSWASRLRGVMVYDPESGQRVPLTRSFGKRETRSAASTGASGSLPTYDLTGDSIQFSKPFADTSLEVWIEIEMAQELFVGDSSKLSTGWPMEAEELLILDTCAGAVEAKQAQGTNIRVPPSFNKRHTEMEQRWFAMIEERDQGPQYSARFNLGA